MDYHKACFNVYNNVNYRQRSLTLQPGALAELSQYSKYPNEFMLTKYFNSQKRAEYANVPLEPEQLFPHHLHQSHPRSQHPHVHTRTQSRHLYHTTCPLNVSNQYYNLEQAIIPTRSRHASPINEPPPMHGRVVQLDNLTIMQVCNELGYELDSNPPVPPARSYTISASRDCVFYKNRFPQERFVKGSFKDPKTGVPIPKGSLVTVLHVSTEDRSKFTVCFQDQHIDIPHQLTQPYEALPWGLNINPNRTSYN